MTGEIDPTPDIREDLARIEREIRDLQSRLGGSEDGTYLGQLVDVRTDGLGDPTITRNHGDVITWDDDRELFVPKAGSAAAVFSYPGVVVDGVESPPLYLPGAITFTRIRISQLTAGGSNLTVAVRVNGSTVTSVTLTSGNTTHTVTTSVAVPAGEPLTIAVTAPGDAANVTVEFF